MQGQLIGCSRLVMFTLEINQNVYIDPTQALELTHHVQLC